MWKETPPYLSMYAILGDCQGCTVEMRGQTSGKVKRSFKKENVFLKGTVSDHILLFCSRLEFTEVKMYHACVWIVYIPFESKNTENQYIKTMDLFPLCFPCQYLLIHVLPIMVTYTHAHYR